MRALRAGIVGLLVAGLVVGCGGPPVGEVSGTVTYDGKPVDQGSIEFHAADGKSPNGGGSISQGKYVATNVPVGPTKVRITGVREPKKMKMYNDPKAEWVQASGGELLPPKYSDEKATELRYDVTAGPQTKDFTLAK